MMDLEDATNIGFLANLVKDKRHSLILVEDYCEKRGIPVEDALQLIIRAQHRHAEAYPD